LNSALVNLDVIIHQTKQLANTSDALYNGSKVTV